ncbi:hypothetical protein EVAR_84624_1 [Eumeta japonica]|uniref:Uncharacterized protein n=1 Tax=Eumeta variegata TaxID=151549 RepID=A0A4C1UZY3_EUMVA|nr:hypothetical protein EVAR_84624_1 [Eumeta japonica]
MVTVLYMTISRAAAMLFSDIDPEPYRNGHRYLAPVNDYRQRSTYHREGRRCICHVIGTLKDYRVSPSSAEQCDKYKIINSFTPAGGSCALHTNLAVWELGMEDKELEVELFKVCSKINILCKLLQAPTGGRIDIVSLSVERVVEIACVELKRFIMLTNNVCHVGCSSIMTKTVRVRCMYKPNPWVARSCVIVGDPYIAPLKKNL